MSPTNWSACEEVPRNMRTFPFFETLGVDIRFATRSLVKNPAFLVVAVLSLALGIAANSTIFSVLDTLLYRPPALSPMRTS